MKQRKYRVIDIPLVIVSDIVGVYNSSFLQKDLLSTQNLTLRWYGVFRSNVLRTSEPNDIFIIVLPSRTVKRYGKLPTTRVVG